MARVIACDNCGAIISERYKRCPECNARIRKGGGFFRLLLLVAVVAAALLLFNRIGGDGTNGLVDRVMDITQINEEHVRAVKYGNPRNYPDITYAEAFENFFGSPTWKYFRGSAEDSSEEYNVVEFTGTCMYQNSEVKARLQFTLSESEETFEATYLSFNDVPQSRLVMLALLDKTFSEYQENHRG